MERLFTPEKAWEAHRLRSLLEAEGVSVHVNGNFIHNEGVGPAEV